MISQRTSPEGNPSQAGIEGHVRPDDRALAPHLLAVIPLLAVFPIALGTASCFGGAHKRVSPRVYNFYATGDIDEILRRMDADVQRAEAQARDDARRIVSDVPARLDHLRTALHADLSPAVDAEIGLAVQALDEFSKGQAVPLSTLSAAVETLNRGFTLSALGDRPGDGDSSRDGGGQQEEGREPQPIADTSQLGVSLNTLALARKNRSLTQKLKDEIKEVEASSATYIVSSEPFFSVGSVVAFDNHLEATAIPVVAYNLYPFEEDFETLGVHALFGGALSGTNGGTDVGLAVGGGFFVPVGKSGSLSLGHVLWDEGGNGENGWYVGLNIGSAAKPTTVAR